VIATLFTVFGSICRQQYGRTGSTESDVSELSSLDVYTVCAISLCRLRRISYYFAIWSVRMFIGTADAFVSDL
jgi:hypothetical protein